MFETDLYLDKGWRKGGAALQVPPHNCFFTLEILHAFLFEEMQIKPNITKIISKRTYILSGVILLEESPSPNSSLSRSGDLCSSTHSTNLTLALMYYQELVQVPETGWTKQKRY